jgi:biopolymer transport protein ExbB
MKFFLILTITLLFTLNMATPSQAAEDMRRQQGEARETLQQLKAKAAAEEEAARREAAQSRETIAADRATLEQAVRQLEEQTVSLERRVTALDAEEKQLGEYERAVQAKLAATDAVVRELVGVLRIHAKDLQSLLIGSLQSAFGDQAGPSLAAIAEQSQFPGMEEIAAMNTALRRQLGDGGAVRMTKGPIVDRSGNTVEAEILVLGNFTAAYRLGE